ncbi:hypothetical protein ELZ30_12780 [Enterococcus faecium]|nr:hypothetical protein [Enterococcus faecium]EGP5196338.1 hypothetical protein [Enterococcus faecium]EGP5311625.1 hypothetical protein [Enterococcus faecium]EGP5329885.1 hypothetical protein [Enterococcus faecium]EGP5361979.1 hypothetical protein [Enterococcus faecium]
MKNFFIITTFILLKNRNNKLKATIEEPVSKTDDSAIFKRHDKETIKINAVPATFLDNSIDGTL